MDKYNHLELARIMGEPLDPKKRYPEIVSRVCETDTADPDEYVYYFDVLVETDKIYVVTSTGAVTQVNAAPDTPASLTFIDVASPEYYIKITDLASAKERTLARKVRTINRSLNAYESWKVLSTAWAAVPAANQFDLTDSSGATRFNYEHLVTMIDAITDYADGYELFVGTTVDKDIKLWDWNDNKYTSLAAALKDLNVTITRIFGSFNIDGSSQDETIFAANRALLFGVNSEVGKPMLFVRKKISNIDLMGGDIKENGEAVERFVYVSPNPVQVGASNRYLAVGVTGLEEIGLAVVNPYALARFVRTN